MPSAGGGAGGGGGGGGGGFPPREVLPGDWSCPSCNASNFARREECFKCHASKGDDSGGECPNPLNTVKDPTKT